MRRPECLVLDSRPSDSGQTSRRNAAKGAAALLAAGLVEDAPGAVAAFLRDHETAVDKTQASRWQLPRRTWWTVDGPKSDRVSERAKKHRHQSAERKCRQPQCKIDELWLKSDDVHDLTPRQLCNVPVLLLVALLITFSIRCWHRLLTLLLHAA